MCAIAAATFATNCALNPEPDGSDADYQAARKLTGSQTKDLPGNDTVTIDSSKFDTSNAIGGGGCITDRNVTVMGKPLTIPLSRVCEYLEILGRAMVAMSFLLAGRILVRG